VTSPAPGAAAQPYLPATDMPRFFREQAAFVGLGQADLELIRRTAPLVLAEEESLTTAIYEHFLQFPEAARFFLGDDGTPDRARLERRRHSLGRWLRETAELATTRDFGAYLVAVGLSHSHRTYGPGGRVPAHLMVGAISLVQTTIGHTVRAGLDDPATAAAAVDAWNKLLLIHLAVLLLGYLRQP
jgi:protoglobin